MSKCWRNNNSLQESKNDDRVAIYVGTYGKYNDGSLQGKWMFPADFDSREDFIDACYELHSDEDDLELMFQDTENLPDSLYSESDFSEEAFDFAVWAEDNDIDAGFAYVKSFGDWDESDFDDKYRGHFDSWNPMEDFAQQYIDNCGGIAEAVNDPEAYFDYAELGRDVKQGMTEGEDDYFLDMSDEDCGKEYIEESYGSVEEMARQNPDAFETYFDLSSFADDLGQNFYEQDGYIFEA